MGQMGNNSITDLKPKLSDFRTEVLQGLMKDPKETHPKFLYDERGSHLFDRITGLEEYYPTRSEIEILEKQGPGIADYIGERSTIIELGGGNGSKGSILLRSVRSPTEYILVDISRDALELAVKNISSKYPGLQVKGVCADYTNYDVMAGLGIAGRKSIVFLGSTIGNMEPEEASQFIANCRKIMSGGDTLTIGVDLKKDMGKLERAYNDSSGITAEFNENLIERINNTFGCHIEKSAFRHHAFYNAEKGRIEMHLESTKDQAISLDGVAVNFRKGETIHTENSYKYSLADFGKKLEDAGLGSVVYWTDSGGNFALFSAKA